MEIEFEKIVSVSSEDQTQCAENLLATKKGWTTDQPGQSTAHVEIKFTKETKIASIDIGNFGSAFVTIEVGNSWTPNEWFAFLPSTKFMDSIDARNGVGVKKVQLFIYDQFHRFNRDKEWDRMRVTCEQMFVKSRKFGLSFLVCRKEIPASRKINKEVIMKEKEIKMLKKLADEKTEKLKNEQKVEDKFDGNNFLNRSLNPSTSTKTPVKVDIKNNQSLKNRVNHLSTPSTTKEQKIDIIKKEKRKREVEEIQKEIPQKVLKLQNKSIPKSPEIKRSYIKSPQIKKVKKSATPEQPVKFNEIMKDVKFTISGYVNPERSRLRDFGLSMGAKFDRNLTSSVTHLICAFVNTPKFRDAMRDFPDCKIVKKEWFILQAETKRKIMYKKYSMKPNDVESEEEYEEFEPDEEKNSEDENFINDESILSSGLSDEESDEIPIPAKKEKIVSKKTKNSPVKKSVKNSTNSDEELPIPEKSLQKKIKKSPEKKLVIKSEPTEIENSSDEENIRIFSKSISRDEPDVKQELNYEAENGSQNIPLPETEPTVEKIKVKKEIIRKYPENVIYTMQTSVSKISFSNEKDEFHCLSTYENTSLEKNKELLFAPLIFKIDETIEDFKKIKKILTRNGGTVKNTVDESTSHVISLKEENQDKNIIYINPNWVLDCHRLKCLLSPFRKNYQI